MQRRSFLKLGPLGAATLIGAPAMADGARWPTKEITIIMPVGAGGGGDLATRPVAAKMSKMLGVPVLVRNMPGGGGVLAASAIAGSAPDGYTIGSVGTFTIGGLPRLTSVPFDKTSFEPLGCWGYSRYGIGVGVNSAIKSIDDLIAAGKKRVVTFSSAHIVNGMAMNQLAALTGAQLRWIPSASAGEAVAQAVGGHVDATIQSLPDMTPQIDGKKMRLLASACDVRWPNYPDVPTLREMGYDASTRAYLCLAGPKDMPAAVRNALEKAILAAADDPETLDALNKLGAEPTKMSAQQFHAFFQEEEPRLIKMVDQEKAKLAKKP